MSGKLCEIPTFEIDLKNDHINPLISNTFMAFEKSINRARVVIASCNDSRRCIYFASQVSTYEFSSESEQNE